MFVYIVIALVIAEFVSIIAWFTPYYQNGLSIYKRPLKIYNSFSEFESDETIVIDEKKRILFKRRKPYNVPLLGSAPGISGVHLSMGYERGYYL
jgi:hypothetical protein